MSNAALLVVFGLAWFMGGKHHFLSALLTLAFNKAYFTSFDNYFIIILICLISAFPEFIENKINGVSKIEISFSITIKAFVILFVLCWYFGIINPIKDFKVFELILNWFKNIGLSLIQYFKSFLFGSWF